MEKRPHPRKKELTKESFRKNKTSVLYFNIKMEGTPERMKMGPPPGCQRKAQPGLNEGDDGDSCGGPPAKGVPFYEKTAGSAPRGPGRSFRPLFSWAFSAPEAISLSSRLSLFRDVSSGVHQFLEPEGLPSGRRCFHDQSRRDSLWGRFLEFFTLTLDLVGPV